LVVFDRIRESPNFNEYIGLQLSVGLFVCCRFHFRKRATSIATYEITNFVHWKVYLRGYDWSSAWVIGSVSLCGSPWMIQNVTLNLVNQV